MQKITVIAVGDARTPLRDELGRWEPGQYVGRDHADNPLAQEVDDTEQVRRALVRGDLALVAPPPGTEPLPGAERPTPTPEES